MGNINEGKSKPNEEIQEFSFTISEEKRELTPKQRAILDEISLKDLEKEKQNQPFDKNQDKVNVKEIEFKNPSFTEKTKAKVTDMIDFIKDALGINAQKSR